MTLTLPKWLEYISHCHSVKLDLSLERVSLVADRLNLRQKTCPVITVAGTNGKGTAVQTLSQIYLASGYKTGAFFSPHIWDYNERIMINGQQATDNQIITAFEIINKIRGHITLTYFEFTLLAALLLYRQAKVDVMVLEVGLGGEFDAVNIIDPDVAVITNIDYDHQKWLGESLESIGQAKAGILRQGIPVVIGMPNPPASILAKAQRLACPVYYAHNNPALCQQVLQLLAAILPAKFIEVPRLPGRCQQLTVGGREIILDASHNPHGVRYLAAFLKTLPEKKTAAIFSCLHDKLNFGLISPLQSIISQWAIVPLATERAASLSAIQSLFAEPVAEYSDIVSALPALTAERIVIYGSFYIISGEQHGIFRIPNLD